MGDLFRAAPGAGSHVSPFWAERPIDSPRHTRHPGARGVSAGNGDVSAHQLVQEVILGEALENAPLAALVLDDEGRYVAVNAHACELTGYERGELMELGAAGIAADTRGLRCRLAALAANGTARGVGRIRRKDGSEVDVGFRGGRTTAAGLPFLVVLLWEDDAATG